MTARMTRRSLIGILLALAFLKFVVLNPRMLTQGRISEQAFDELCFHQLYVQFFRYGMEHDGRYPDDWSEIVWGYGRDRQRRVLYKFVHGVTPDSPTNTVMAYLPPGNYPYLEFDSAIVLFADGRVQRMKPATFRQMMAASNRIVVASP